jgi:Zn-dependent metalloprotease
MFSANSSGKLSCNCVVCFAMPPYMADYIRLHSKDKKVLEALAATQRSSTLLRQMRTSMLAMPRRASIAPQTPNMNRRIYDCRNTTDLLNRLVRKEGGKATKDLAALEAYDFSGLTFEFFSKVFGRASVDNANLPLTSSVHYQEDPRFGYDNAFWNGNQMVYGDGSLFNRMTVALDVVAHELTHGVTQYSAGLKYEMQSGALNEHMSDVFGVMVRQWVKKQKTPSSANWSVGEGIFRKLSMKSMSLRSLSSPGTAYDDADFGKDPQPAHMNDFVELPNTEEGDWGGVHYNSGIPNKAFYLASVAIGKPSWEVAGRIWYVTLTERLRDNADFKKCASETISVARDYFGADIGEKVRNAWETVGVIVAGEGPIDG